MRIMKLWPALALAVAAPAFAQDEEQAEQQAEQLEQQAEQQAEQQEQQAQQQQEQQAQQQQAQQQPQQLQAPQQQGQMGGQQQMGQAGGGQGFQVQGQGQQQLGQQQGLQAPQFAQPGSNYNLGQGGLQQSQGSSYSIGTVQGTVTGLDFQRGVIALSSAGGNIQLRARPMDIVNLNPGDVVALQFANYQGALWVAPSQAGAQPQHFAQYGTLTGPVTNVNKQLGTITVRGQTLRAHPEQLESIIPGQFISIGYANVAGTNWVAGLQAAGGGGGMGGGY